jgi:DNA-binding NarL/FixJ family response regulator
MDEPNLVATTQPTRHMLSTAMKKTRIVLADDQLLVRAGIRALLEALPDCQIDAECADGLQAVAEIRRLKPDIALLDIAMPGLNGIEVSQAIRQFDRRIKILILSSIDRKEVVDQALAAGIDGYLLKDFVLDELRQALDAVLANRSFLSPKIRDLDGQPRQVGQTGSTTSLTARQTQILRLVASGMTSKEIARDLGISPKTVEFHRARLMERLAVHDVTALTRYAIQAGVVSWTPQAGSGNAR